MGDIWSNVGATISAPGQDWLYQKEGQVHGPVPKSSIEAKLLAGEIDAKTLVAREGSEFHPAGQVAAFADALKKVKRQLDRKAARKRGLVFFAILVLLGSVGAGGGFYFKREADRKKAQLAEQARLAEKKREAEQQERDKVIGGKVELVALVSFDAAAMEVGGKENKPSPGRNKPTPGRKKPGGEGGDAPGPAAPPPMVAQCERSTQEILGVLGKHLRTINVCVQDEKGRDTEGLLPPTLKLAFVARPDGKVSDFNILDRHYAAGPMRNCMVKAFNLVKFPPAGGSNCPVTIPIKIGG